MFILRFDFVFFLLAWHSIRVNAMLCSCFVRQFSPWHNPNKLALPFSSAPRQFSNKFDIALGLSSVWLLLIWLNENVVFRAKLPQKTAKQVGFLVRSLRKLHDSNWFFAYKT